MLNVVMLSVIMLSVIMLSVVMLIVIMLSVVAPLNALAYNTKKYFWPPKGLFLQQGQGSKIF